MNVSAPTSAPDLAGLALPATTPDMPAPFSGFAPSRLAAAGAGQVHSFQSALAALLLAEGKPEGDSKQPEAKNALTGVVVPVPAPESLPLKLTTPLLQVTVLPQATPAAAAEPAEALLQEISKPKSPKAPLQTLAVPFPAADAPPAAVAVPLLTPAPQRPEADPHFTLTPEMTGKPVAAPFEPPAATAPAAAPAPELPNVAFVEKFTPVTAAAQEEASTAMPRLPSGGATPPAAGKNVSVPAAQTAGNAPLAPAAGSQPSGHGPEHHQDNEPRQRSSADTPAPAKTDVAAPGETLQPVAAPSALPHDASVAERSAPFTETKPAETRPPDAELNGPAPAPQTHPAEAHTLSLRVNDAADQRVELNVTDRAGEVHVTVRAGDADLAGSLRDNLGDLVHKLEQSGFRTESWQPAQPTSSASNHQDHPAEKEFSGGDHAGQQQQQHAGDGRERRQQDPERAHWIEAIENSIASDSERNIWLPV